MQSMTSPILSSIYSVFVFWNKRSFRTKGMETKGTHSFHFSNIFCYFPLKYLEKVWRSSEAEYEDDIALRFSKDHMFDESHCFLL